MRKFIRICFYHFYHTFAWTYDFVAMIVSVGRWQDWGRAALPYVRGPRILEIGFGPGHLQVALNQLSLHTFGLDESWQMIHLARANLRHANLPVLLTRSYAQQIPYATGCFDCILSTFPSEYIMDTRTLKELMRVLKPGGHVVVLPVAGMRGPALPDRFASWLFRITGQSAEVTSEIESHYRNTFSQAGFQVQITRTEIRQSTVMIILAEKPAIKEC
jgi:ubiquinone/menaquinone biosynthesis C-methylase UbiE